MARKTVYNSLFRLIDRDCHGMMLAPCITANMQNKSHIKNTVESNFRPNTLCAHPQFGLQTFQMISIKSCLSMEWHYDWGRATKVTASMLFVIWCELNTMFKQNKKFRFVCVCVFVCVCAKCQYWLAFFFAASFDGTFPKQTTK